MRADTGLQVFLTAGRMGIDNNLVEKQSGPKHGCAHLL